jgi:uncharacterized protein YndB with AHSA1/START domain
VTETDRAVVEQTLRIEARPETVWRYWTDPERLCAWWGAAAEVDPRPGGVCRIDMGGDRAVMRGEYLELVPYERLVFTFGWEDGADAPPIAPGSTTVEVTLTPDAGDTILTLRHSGLPTDIAGRHDEGWRHFLPILAEVAPAAA